jgi:hypothetical protein
MFIKNYKNLTLKVSGSIIRWKYVEVLGPTQTFSLVNLLDGRIMKMVYTSKCYTVNLTSILN